MGLKLTHYRKKMSLRKFTLTLLITYAVLATVFIYYTMYKTDPMYLASEKAKEYLACAFGPDWSSMPNAALVDAWNKYHPTLTVRPTDNFKQTLKTVYNSEALSCDPNRTFANAR